MGLFRYLVLTAFFIGLSTPIHAAEATWEIDKDHSGFHFGVKHIYAPVKGYFADYKGTVTFSPDNPTASNFTFDIQVKSIATGNSKRDKHLLSEDFFSAKKYPLITFRSSSVTTGPDGELLVKGTLTMRETSHEITLPLVFHGSKPHPAMKGSSVAGFTGGLLINRLDYKVGNGKFAEMGLVDKDVQINVGLEVIRKE